MTYQKLGTAVGYLLANEALTPRTDLPNSSDSLGARVGVNPQTPRFATGLPAIVYRDMGYDTNRQTIDEIEAFEEAKLRKDPLFAIVKTQVAERLGGETISVDSTSRKSFQSRLHDIVQEASDRADPTKHHDIKDEDMKLASMVRLIANDMGYDSKAHQYTYIIKSSSKP